MWALLYEWLLDFSCCSELCEAAGSLYVHYLLMYGINRREFPASRRSHGYGKDIIFYLPLHTSLALACSFLLSYFHSFSV